MTSDRRSPTVTNLTNLQPTIMPENISLGQANHNPLNIRYAPANKWLGLDEKRPNVKGFCRFRADAYGYRAAVKLICTYMTKYDIRTPEGICQRWAPPSENHTLLYTMAVCGRAHLRPNERLTPRSEAVARLVAAMARQESGMHITPQGVEEIRRRFGV